MYTLPGHVEFLSDAWLEEARQFLAREFAVRKDRLGGRAFSLSECFANAPPHLGLPDGVASWKLHCDAYGITVARGFDADADVVVQGDYQVGVAAAQFVGVLAPGAMQQMQRELAAYFGAPRFPANWLADEGLKVRGTLQDAEAAELLALLHDHMGRRTVENPDLAHRARRLRIDGNVRQMEAEGYTIIERAISPEFADEMRAATLRALLPHQTFSMNWMLYHGREFEQLIQNPLLMTLIDASLGRGAVIASFSSIKRGPGKGAIPIHTDYAHVPEPYPEFAVTGVGVWALEDWTPESGPTWIVPGTHKLRRGPRPGENPEGAVPVTMPKGSVVFFTHGCWHWQGDRSEPGDRVTLHAHFNRGIMRSLEPKKTDVQMLHRNAPRLGEMLGEDDWFDKMSAQGRDHVRFQYMMKLLAYNEQRKRELLAPATA